LSGYDVNGVYHKQKAAEAAYDQAEAQYRSTVITAFQNVAGSLRAKEAGVRALKAATKAVEVALNSLDIVRKQARPGHVNSLVILNVQQTGLTALLARVQAQANRYTGTAALFQALGGGWWNPLEIPSR
jgi:outer membrane protein TolC